MRLSNIAHLYLVRVKARVVLVQELFAVLGIAVGVALLFASQIAGTSLDSSVDQLNSGVVGQSTYQLKARGPDGFSEALLGKVQRLAGVRAAVPILERQATLVGPHASRAVDLIATEPRYVHLAGPLLAHFTASQLARQRAIALPVPIAEALGVESLDVVGLQIGATIAHALVGAELSSRSIGRLLDSPVAIAPLSYAQELAHMPGQLTRIFVQVKLGREREVWTGLSRLAAGQINVEPAGYEATLFAQAAQPVDQSTKTFAAISALVGFMFAYCSMLLTADSRRGLVRELRRSGATRGEIVKTLLFDAVVIAAIAAVLGLALGDALSILAFSSPPGFLAFAFPVSSQRIVTPSSAILAAGVGALAACVGVLTPMLDSLVDSRRRPARSAREPFGSRRRIAALLSGGCACIAATTVILLLAPQSAIVGLIALIVALLLLLPLLLDAVLAGFERLQRSFGNGATMLAVLELRSPLTHNRSLAVAATAAVAVFGSVTIQSSHANLQNGLNRAFHGISSVAPLWVAPSGAQSLFTTVPFASTAAFALERVPGVRSVGAYRGGFLEYGGRRVWVLAPPPTVSTPIPSGQLLDGNRSLASARLRAGGWAVLSKTLAGENHLRIGQAFVLPAPQNTRLRVAGLTTNLGWPPGAIVLNDADYARAWESSAPSAYTVTLQPGATAATVIPKIRGALRAWPGLTVETAAQRERSQRAASRQGLGRLTQIALLVLIAGALATATVMGAMLWQRRRRFARMKVQGLARAMLFKALICESALLIGTGCLLGAALGVYGQLLLSHALVVVTGFPVIVSANLGLALASFAVVTVVAGACVAIPGYRATAIAAYPWPES